MGTLINLLIINKIHNNMNKEFTRVRSVKDIIISSVLLIGGAVLVALPTATSINIIGFFMIFAGIILSLVLKTGYKDNETGVRYCKTERFFAQSMRQDILDAIATKPESTNLSEEDKGNGIRLDIYHSKESNKAYIQLFEYIPYKYEPCSRIYEYELKNVNKIL